MMDDLVLIPKKSFQEALEGKRTGRKPRQTFGIRSYDGGSTIVLVVPQDAVTCDRVDFYQNSMGFAIRIHADGERAISQRKNSRTINVPPEVKTKITMPKGTIDLHCEDRGDGLFFFPFSQFQ